MIKDTRLLLEFVAVAKAESFTKAARELGVAQPWLSAQVRKLEEQLGVRLFDRSSRQVELTDWGRELLSIALPLSVQTGEVMARIAVLTHLASNIVRIGVPPGDSYNVVMQIFKDARLASSNSEIFIERGVSHSLLDRLRQGALDLTFLIGPFDHRDLDILSVCQLSIGIVVRDTDPLSQKKRLCAADLKGRKIAAFSREMNPGLYDSLFISMEAEGVATGGFPEQALAGEMHPSLWPEQFMKLALSTDPLDTTAPAGAVRVPFTHEHPCWLYLVCLKGNSAGRAIRRIWCAAQTHATEA